MCSHSAKPLGFYEDRYRGSFACEGVFLFYPHDGEDLMRMEPYGYSRYPRVLWERMLSANNAAIGEPMAGGNYDLTKFDFTLVRVPEEEIPGLFVRLVTTMTPAQVTSFGKYFDAQIHLNSHPSSYGTIRAVLAERGVQLI